MRFCFVITRLVTGYCTIESEGKTEESKQKKQEPTRNRRNKQNITSCKVLKVNSGFQYVYAFITETLAGLFNDPRSDCVHKKADSVSIHVSNSLYGWNWTTIIYCNIILLVHWRNCANTHTNASVLPPKCDRCVRHNLPHTLYPKTAPPM